MKIDRTMKKGMKNKILRIILKALWMRINVLIITPKNINM